MISNFSERLKLAMELRNLKSSDIQKRSELLVKNNELDKSIKMPMITDYIKGRYKANQNNVYALAKILGVSPTWLMGYDVPMEDGIIKENIHFIIPVLR